MGNFDVIATTVVDGETLTAKFPMKVVKNENQFNSYLEFNHLLSFQYSYDDCGYYYANDKKSWQKGFGFARIYDYMAPYIGFEYDYERVFFTYDNQDFMVQFWKGQYGYAFVGGEVGVYTRKIGSSGSHFNCAKQEDWLNMEMCFMWDEYQTGEYRPVFNRPYDKYWWCTGFVVGFDGGKNRHQFRLVTHITFKDVEMADAFCEAFEKNGFEVIVRHNKNDWLCFECKKK